MDSINPHNLPPTRWSAAKAGPQLPVSRQAPDLGPEDSVRLQTPPSSEKSRPSASPEAPLAALTILPQLPFRAGVVEQSATDLGLSLTPTGGLTQLEAPAPASASQTLETPKALSDWLNSRARPVFSPDSLDSIAAEIQPLVSLVSGKPDPSRWNRATWNCFQLASQLPQEALAEGAALPLGLQIGLSDPGVDRDTLGRMLRLRTFASQMIEAELPTLMSSERERYLEMVHDQGYALPQMARAQDPTALLCSVGSPELLESARLSLLPPQTAERLRLTGGRKSTDFTQAFPRLNLSDFFSDHESGDAASQKKALSFLEASGKEVDKPSPELGDQSMRQFLQRHNGESRGEFLQRLSGKQVLNALARPWKELQTEIAELDRQGGGGEALQSELKRRQTPALAPILLMLNAPSLSQLAEGGGEQASQTMDALMQVFYRATNPHLSFDEPLISQGLEQLQQTHQEQLSKDRLQWTSVVALKKTPILAGLSDGLYEQRTSQLPRRRIEEVEDHLEAALARLKRDLGTSPAYHQIVAQLKPDSLDQDTVTRLHALRFDPTSFAVELPGQRTEIQLGNRSFSISPQGTCWQPEFVSATSVAFRVQSEDGQDSLLRLPKGARPQISEDGTLQLEVFDAERYQDVAARLKDFQFLDARVQLTDRELLEFEGGLAVLEKRTAVPDAGVALQQGGKLSRQDVSGLVDQWLAGVAEVDPQTRPFGVLYELGPDNYTLGTEGLQGSYVDIALPFRNQRERASFGFVTGGYGSAANWVVADNQPLSEKRVEQIWQGQDLSPAESDRRNLFVQAFEDRLDPEHPVWQTLPPEQRAQAYGSFLEDVAQLGLSQPGALVDSPEFR